MKIVIAGGSGYLGRVLSKHYASIADEIIILSRIARPPRGNVKTVLWDAKNIGPWTESLENTDVLINLTGKNVNCRYHEKNKLEIMSSRVESTLVLGKAVTDLKTPPALWIQSSSATIYRHSEDRNMDEESGEYGNTFSEEVCRQWEKTFWSISLPHTRRVVLRTGIVLGRTESALPRLINLVRFGAGGAQGKGKQYMSWIHERDFINVIEWVRSNPSATGTYNCTAPNPVMNVLFMRALRNQMKIPIGFGLPVWLLEVGAALIGTETELILKSRRVVPKRLLLEGFTFEFPVLALALKNLLLPDHTRLICTSKEKQLPSLSH